MPDAPSPAPFLGQVTDDHEYVDRFVLSFKDLPGTGRRVPLTCFNTWMGQTREKSIHPIAAGIRGLFTTGAGVAAVTRGTKLRLYDEAALGDILEVRCRAFQNDDGSRCDGEFTWLAIGADGSQRLLATGCMETAFVRLIGFGVGQSAPAPDFWRLFFAEHSCGMPGPQPTPPPGVGLYTRVPRTTPLFRREVPQTKPFLCERTFETGQQDSNLVGNLYFAHYALWQERLAEAWFFRHLPGLYRDPREHRELVCVALEVRHIREAMPFDSIRLRMHLLALETNLLSLHFDAFRVESTGALTKLAVGRCDYVLVERSGAADPRFLALPSEILSVLTPLMEETH